MASLPQDHADVMNDLMRRYKTAVKASLALEKKEDISARLAQVDALLAGLTDTRAALARAVAEDAAALLALRSREAALAGEVQALEAQHGGHAGERVRTGAALAASAQAQAGLVLLAAGSVRAAAGAAVRSLAREATGELRSARGYTSSVSHRVDLTCTGFLPDGTTRPTVVTHPRTIPRAEGGGGGPAFSPMRPRGGCASKAGGLTILSSKGGGAVGITSAVSQGARITLQDEAQRLGYRAPEDRAFAAVTAQAREMSITRLATGM
jgi:hypothetical protein